MSKEVKPIRQGDVWLIPLSEDEERSYRTGDTFKTVPRTRGEGLILAEGEATGHHHRIRTRGARLRQRGSGGHAQRVLVVPKSGAQVTHEEHAALEIPQGLYKVQIAREYVAPTPTRSATSRYVYD